MSKLTICLRHISEVFLYEYYCLGDDEYEISEEDTLTLHKGKVILKYWINTCKRKGRNYILASSKLTEMLARLWNFQSSLNDGMGR